MSWDSQRFRTDFEDALERFDHAAVERLCARFVQAIQCGEEAPSASMAGHVLNALQRKRFFDQQVQVADAFLQTGRDSPSIRRKYAQALLDRGELSAATPFLELMLADIGDAPGLDDERAEARGLLGRAHKQTWVNIRDGHPERAAQALNRAIALYLTEFRHMPERNAWHGINAVALLLCAVRHGVDVDGITSPGDEAAAVAQTILEHIRAKWLAWEVKLWDAVTAMEACVALDEHEEAVIWLQRYVSEPLADAFEIGSTVRQLEEVWQLNVDAAPGSALLPVLRAELLQRMGGSVIANAEQLREGALANAPAPRLERVFGAVRYQSYRFMQRSIACARSVARIEQGADQGHGTGFLLRGGDLHADWGDGFVLLTNAHVVSNDPAVKDALHPDDVTVTFQLLEEEGLAREEYTVTELLWTSPPWQLDVSVLRLDATPDGVEPFRVHPRLPVPDGDQRVYIIGHPRGGSLSFSIQDNLLLDHEDPYLHYRAPTEGGSSGSPVFNAQWRLIGLHHAGDQAMRRLNGKDGTYEANEGIWIQSIIRSIAAAPSA